MKILKSGIEMEHSDLNRVRGGACACGCRPFIDGDSFNVGGDAEDCCACMCRGTENSADRSDLDTDRYIFPTIVTTDLS